MWCTKFLDPWSLIQLSFFFIWVKNEAVKPSSVKRKKEKEIVCQAKVSVMIIAKELKWRKDMGNWEQYTKKYYYYYNQPNWERKLEVLSYLWWLKMNHMRLLKRPKKRILFFEKICIQVMVEYVTVVLPPYTQVLSELKIL